MDSSRFDRLTQALAQSHLNRRAALGAASAAVASVAMEVATTRAQGTPPAADVANTEDSTLFVQTAAGGTFLPNTMASPEAGAHGTHLLTLSGHPGQTIQFANRPKRDFGQIPTTAFLSGLGFTPDNPANAALVVSIPAGADDILVLELLNPSYDDDSNLLLYEANTLGEYAGENLAPVADRQEDDELASEFGHASLFIDDCSDQSITCCTVDCNGADCHCLTEFGTLGPVGFCWSFGDICCHPCQGDANYWAGQCNSTFSNCKNECTGVTKGCW